ncbi:MAG: bacterial transcriptional activator domain-containing protein [Nitrospira sp.]|nr:bacterial transcriptional activator domain-containing protein [Nitrospira sp.]
MRDDDPCTMGRRPEAIGVCQRFSHALRAKLGVAPAPETISLYHDIANSCSLPNSLKRHIGNGSVTRFIIQFPMYRFLQLLRRSRGYKMRISTLNRPCSILIARAGRSE